MIYGNPVLQQEEKLKDEKPKISLFTHPPSLKKYDTPATMRSSSTAGSSLPTPSPTRPSKNSNQNQLKSLSIIGTTPRQVPYANPNKNLMVSNSTFTHSANKEPVVDDTFLSQLFDGVDTDELFGNF